MPFFGLGRYVRLLGNTSEIEQAAPGSGKGLFALRDISLREEILDIHEPLVTVLDKDRLKDACYYCHFWREKVHRGRVVDAIDENTSSGADEETKKLLTCTGCGIVAFCDKYCQKQSWNDHHRFECPIFTEVKPRILPNNVRAILRILLSRKYLLRSESLWKQLLDLEGHMEKLDDEGGERWNDLRLMAKVAKEVSRTPESEQTVLGLFCRLLINSVPLTTISNEQVGLALDPIIARLNHSCDPNATIRFTCRGQSIGLVPLRPIASEEEITISYIDSTMPFHRRQQELSQQFFFKCRCSLCKEGIHGQPDRLVSLSHDQVFQYDTVHSVEQHAVNLMEAANSDDSNSGAIQKLKYGLHLLSASNLFPVHRYPFGPLRQQLTVAYLTAHQFHLAFVQAAIQYLRIDPVIMIEHNPVRVAHAWLLVRLISYIVDGNEWATQHSEIHSRNFKLHWLQWDVLEFLEKQRNKVYPHTALFNMMNTKRSNHPGKYPGRQKSAEQMQLEWDRVEELIDETLRQEKQWGGGN